MNVLISLNSHNLMIWVYYHLWLIEAETEAQRCPMSRTGSQLLSERVAEPGQPENSTLFSFFLKNQFYPGFDSLTGTKKKKKINFIKVYFIYSKNYPFV